MMSPLSFTHVLTQTADGLSESGSYKRLSHQHKDGEPLSLPWALCDVIELARSILFPGYYGNLTVNSRTINYHIGVNVEKLLNLPTEQTLAGSCFGNGDRYNECIESRYKEATRLAVRFINKLPHLCRVSITNIEVAYNGDPAARSFGEVILCHPAIKAVSSCRIVHELLGLGVPLIPRIVTEMAYSETRIDIYPGARIGMRFTIDHGTGVVIEATSITSNSVKLYQGVILGARSFPPDVSGKPIKGTPHYSTLEDSVIVCSNTTILGRITTGRDTAVGGSIWVTKDIPAGVRIVQAKARKQYN